MKKYRKVKNVGVAYLVGFKASGSVKNYFLEIYRKLED